MKTIYTSNYARIKQFSAEYPDCYIVATSVWVPRWFIGSCNEQRKEIAPTWEIVKAINDGEISFEDYEKAYLKLLEERKVDASCLIDSLPNNTFLLCFESPTDFCHRHTLSNWIYEKTGLKIPEWMNKKERERAQKDGLVDSFLDLE